MTSKNRAEPSRDPERGWFLRKIFHLLFALTIIYYLLPLIIFGIPRYFYFIVLFIFVPVVIEFIRLKKGISFLGLHEHEKSHIASYLWFSFGATILIVSFPQQIAAPCIVATALGDPVIGMMKPYRRRFMISITYLICLVIFLLFRYEILLALLAAGITFIAESFEFKIRIRLRSNLFWSRSKKRISKYSSLFDFLFRTDDDFIMQIIPAVTLSIIFLITPELIPEQILNPIPELLQYV